MDAVYMWSDLMPSPLFNASYVILQLLRAFSVPGGLHQTNSASYLRARNVIWTAPVAERWVSNQIHWLKYFF
jgi:hypothetical protein